ncbi:XkdF-like putative serine protease domain-containing protein [Campylobacter pinnipediorum]|uniref:XkdF-like putative serine protease domain-containing protein n=1 Tax=Campylobacter pinnipediorum TaxID=1965231 RepID=UPI00084D75BB|nr:XkdF-like putative serine protease domain-containing protein [Campylobacter pinnipediorum]AQW80783.1 putative phage protease [Campylobacter pinnipediorum subsp. pinnipediorum]AQW83331.1 putative phage protease [Campylobacter pinnipediorum subsp. pinnipediorum]OPA75425.1 hypothetical protein BFG05_06010 [Campylobacter pinnipediorum subsp. pinnipediorum]
MKNRLKDLNITHISLVKAGANGKSIIYKSSDVKTNYEKTINIAKSDTEKGVVYGIVYAPDEVDTQGDLASAAEIEKAAYAFMKGLNGANVDRDHNFKPDGAYVAESWIVRENDALFKSEKVGSWAVAIKLESEELKQAVKKGEIAGISMAGTGEREALNKSDSGIAEAIAKGFSVLFEKFSKGEKVEQNQNKDNESIQKAISDGFGKLGESIEKLNARVDELEKNAKNSKQSDNVNKSDELEGVL